MSKKVSINAGVCDRCGALVRGTLNETRHIKFHADFDEVVEWAQHISKMFVEEQELPARLF